jgi:hypothetical protein
MKHSIIGEIYSNWTKTELKKLNKFITTSQWSRSETIVQCHQCLASYATKNKLEDLNKEILFQLTYPTDDYNDSKLRFTLNRLLEAIKEFVLLEENEKKNIHSEKIWMDFIQYKRLKKNILLNIENDYEPQNSQNKLLHHYFKSVLKGNYMFSFSSNVEEKYNSLIEMTKKAEEFSDFVFLRQYVLALTFYTKYNSSENQEALVRYHAIKGNIQYDLYIEFQTYISLIEMLHNQTIESYYAYKNLIFESFQKWDNEDKIHFISYLLNFTSSQINQGNINFIEEQSSLYDQFESNGIFNIPGYLSGSKINNVVFIYLKKKEYAKAEEFINRYLGTLLIENAESCRHFNLARIRFENSKYKESLRELLQVDFGRDAFYSINSKVLLLKNYYELKESDAFASLITSFKEFIKKNKIISESHKISIMNYIKMVDKVYAVTSGKAKKLEEEIKNHSQIIEKNWLLEKIAERTR